MITRCAACGIALTDYRGSPMPGAIQCISSLFGSNHILCKSCSEHEELWIEQEGTNNIPKLLARYLH